MVKVSAKLPFWAKDNDNKASIEIINKFKAQMQEMNLAINFIDEFSITVNLNKHPLDNQSIKYIYVPVIDAYFYYDALLKIANNVYVCKFIMDIYATHTIKFIEQNLDTELVFLRTHNYDKKVLQINDKFIDEIPKIYKKYEFKKSLFNYDQDKKIWYGANLGLKGDDLLNANKYYVFKDGPNGGYEFYPIVSIAKDSELYYKSKIQGAEEYSGTFYNGIYDNFGNKEKKNNIPSDLNAKVVDAYQNDKVINYYYRPTDYRYQFPAHGVFLKNWTIINNVPYGTLPIDIVANTKRFNNAGAGLQEGQFYAYVLGNQFYGANHWNITAAWHAKLDESCREFTQFMVKIFKTTYEYKKITINNSIVQLEALRKRPDYINKFLGIYYMPHLLNFNRFDQKEKYIYFTLNPRGDQIDLFKIYDYNMSKIENKLNNNTYSTPYFLKYLNVKYFNNLINAEYRVNEQHSIYIGGKIFFTDTCNIISKSDELLNLNNSIINYPYMLPIGVDQYEQYVKANRNVTDTGYAIEKQKADLAIGKNIFNGVMDYFSNSAKATGKALIGNTGGAVSSTVDAFKSVGNSVFGVLEKQQGLKHTEMKIRAQYEQASNTMGNTILHSNIINAALTQYYDAINEQYEGVEVSELEDNILLLINNYIFLNGYLLPQKDTFNNRIKNNRQFNFIQLDAQLLLQRINLKNNDNLVNNIYELVYEQLTNGVRIWNTETINELPEYNPNEQWPDQPPVVRPPIAPEKPPIDNEPVIKINGDINYLGFNSPYYDLFFFAVIRGMWIFQTSYNGVNFTPDWETQFTSEYNNEKKIIINLKFNGDINRLNPDNFTLFYFTNLKGKNLTFNITCNIPFEKLKQWAIKSSNYLIVDYEESIYQPNTAGFDEYNPDLPFNIIYNGVKIYGPK